jgi:hypothetical protein
MGVELARLVLWLELLLLMILLKFTELLIYAEPKKFEFLGQYEKP